MSAADSLPRCGWCLGHEIYRRYHDEEWGVPVREERAQFEFLCLEGAQAGLSWLTILRKRENYRRAFDGFDPEKIARYDAGQAGKLLADPGIVRNRRKIEAFVNNARRVLALWESGRSLSELLWGFVDGEPVRNHWRTLAEVPANTEVSDRMSRELKRLGFRFVGSTICYAHMQATGMVNDHLVCCHRHGEV